MRKRCIILLVIIFAGLVGCENSERKENEGINLRVIASEKIWPENFNQVSFQREDSPHYNYLVKKVNNQNDYLEAWDYYQFTINRPHVDFDKKEVLFLGLEESGSCPEEIKKQDLKLTKQQITIVLTGPNGSCTTDATPRAFVVEIPKVEMSEKIKEVTIIEGKTKTVVPLMQL